MRTNGVLLPDSIAAGFHTAQNAGFLNALLYLGARNQSSFFYKGYLDELKIESITPPAVVTNYWNTTSAAAQSFNNTANWSEFFVPRAADTAIFTNWGNFFTLSTSSPVTNRAVVVDAINQTLEMRPSSVNWRITDTLNIGNSVSGKSTFRLENLGGTIAVTNAAGTGTVYVNWGTAGQGRLQLASSAANMIVDHLYASNSFASVGLDTIDVGTLTTLGDSELANISATFYLGTIGGAVGQWNIKGGTNTVRQTMFVGAAGVYGATTTGTGVVSVAGPTAVLLAKNQLYVGAQGNGVGSLIISNGGRATVSGEMRVGNNGPGGNQILVTGTNSLLETSAQVWLRSYSENNAIRVQNSGKWIHNTGSAVYFNGVGTATNTSVTIDGPGSSFVGWGDVFLGGGAGVDGRGKIVISNGGVMSNSAFGNLVVGQGAASYGEVLVTGPGSYLYGPAGVLVIGRGNAWNGTFAGTGRVDVANGGILEHQSIWMGSNSFGSLSIKDGGVFQFGSTSLGLSIVQPGNVLVSNAVISFRGIGNANILGNQIGTELTNVVFQGNNTFRLNAASNATGLASYTFHTGLGATNYANLQLTGNGSLWRSTTLTIGSGGSFSGSGTVAANTTNLGTIAPGFSAGVLTFTSNLVLGSTSLLQMEIGGTNPTDYDRLIVEGDVTLAGALSILPLNAFTPTPGDTFTLIDNQGPNLISG